MGIVLRNIMEEYVISTLDHIMKNLDCCKCEKCRLDIASYALNRLPSKYVVSNQGELMSKLCEFDHGFESQVIATLTLGADVIKKNPRH